MILVGLENLSDLLRTDESAFLRAKIYVKGILFLTMNMCSVCCTIDVCSSGVSTETDSAVATFVMY